jgi:multidrug efflux pump subunit AcrA (membrane-fusion protein)
LEIDALKVEKGQHVEAGAPLCVLTDHAVLYAQGKAFEVDIAKLTAAAQNGWTVAAVFESNENRRQLVEGLRILYLANEIDADSRAFFFYVPLPNELVRDNTTDSGQRFIDWRFRPGQRARLLVPLEPASERIVLPVEAVVQEGAESYVFEYHRDHFDRRSVHVEYRDQDRVVIANDGVLKPGVQVAINGAYQLHLAAQNKSAAPLDPHAGHNH